MKSLTPGAWAGAFNRNDGAAGTESIPNHHALRPQRFARRLGTFSNVRLAFNAARFLSSALIFSIRVIASGV
jgi:hypothetical protein